MKYEEKLEKSMIVEWRDCYLNYKGLKECLKPFEIYHLNLNVVEEVISE
jgi:SPX domain protein involved in polyphosphate accumulation